MVYNILILFQISLQHRFQDKVNTNLEKDVSSSHPPKVEGTKTTPVRTEIGCLMCIQMIKYFNTVYNVIINIY